MLKISLTNWQTMNVTQQEQEFVSENVCMLQAYFMTS